MCDENLRDICGGREEDLWADVGSVEEELEHERVQLGHGRRW